MTQQRDLKRRVRERQSQTGESYMAALRHVLADRPSAITVLDFVEVSDVATALGLTCKVTVLGPLVERLDVAGVLLQLRGVLLSTAADPALELMRAVVLQATVPDPLPRSSLDSNHRFRARVRAGLGGVSECGRMLAFAITGRRTSELVVFGLGLLPRQYTRPPLLIITSPDTMNVGPALDWTVLR